MGRGTQPWELCFFCNGSQAKDPIRTGASEENHDYGWEAGRRRSLRIDTAGRVDCLWRKERQNTAMWGECSQVLQEN